MERKTFNATIGLVARAEVARGVPLGMSRICPEYPDAHPHDCSVAGDVLFRREPDDENEEQEDNGDDREQDDDDNKDDGYSE